MKLSREQMLAEMGIKPLWRERDALPATDVAPVIAEAPPAALPAGHPLSGLASADAAAVDRRDWPQLAEAVAACRACVLCEQRKQAVLGVGDRHPEWLFIGEGPGAEEDARGEPFVGQAGKLLDNMLAALGLARGDGVYIANAVKCRPPGNRTPEAGEMAACRPWLERQVALLEPKVIVLLGKAAVHALLHGDKALAVLRGKRHEYRGIPAVVTYHPAYLLRNLPDKAKAWEDLLFARRCLREASADEAGLPF
jgi:uracil-DNA glycosylase